MGLVTKAGSILGRNAEPKARETRELLHYTLAVLAVLAFGTVGFTLIEGWSVFDSFYMTVITLSTVGYQEVHPLSHHGREFAVVLIFSGVGVAMAVLPRLAAKIIKQEIRWLYERGNMQEKIKELNGHTIFCGYGRLTQNAAKQLKQAGKTVVIIDAKPEKVEEARKEGFLVVKGDATDEDTLKEAGIENAAQLASLLSKDSDNLYVILTVKELAPHLMLLSRADDPGSEKRLLRAGATRILAPYRVGGEKIASGLLKPYVTDFLDLTSSGRAGSRIQIEEIKIEPGSSLAGLTLQSADLRKRTNIIVAAMIDQSGKMTMNPGPDTVIAQGSTLIGFGTSDDFASLAGILEGR